MFYSFSFYKQVKELAKNHKDKAEFDRMKREVAKSTVEKGVNECTRLTKMYEKKRLELEKQQEDVRQKFEEEKIRVTYYVHVKRYNSVNFS